MDDSLLDLEIIKAASMSEEELRRCPQVLAAVAIIIHDRKILSTYNPKWGLFTLPMTKVKDTFINADGYVDATPESWVSSASFAAGEHLGPDHGITPEYLMIVDDFMASGRDKQTKRYTLGVYKFAAQSEDLPDSEGRQWITATQFMNEVAPLMSKTALRVINVLIESAEELGVEF